MDEGIGRYLCLTLADAHGPIPLANASFRFLDWRVIDAGNATLHKPVLGKLPQLVPIRPVPLSGVVMPFIFEGHGNAVAVVAP